MLPAVLHFRFRSPGNRLAWRARCLEPSRYLFGAIIGGTCLRLMFARSFLPRRRVGRPGGTTG